MNIILFTNSIDYGGASTYYTRMNKSFIENGVKSKLIFFKNEKENLDNYNYNLFEKLKIIRKQCQKENADFIITNYGLETIMAKIATIFLKKIKVISVVHIRSIMWIPNYKNIIKKYIFKLMIKFSFLICDKCIAVSDGLRKEIIKERWINERKIVTLYNPVIQDSFNHRIKNIEGKKEIHLGIIGWIWDIKNQEEAINAVYRLNDRKYKLHIIGGVKDENYYLKLKEIVKKFDLEKQVFFEGVKTDIFKELENIDILILSSKTEALPTVIVEAMATGTPIIATNCKFGPEELLKDGVGLIYQQNNQDQLIEYIVKLSNDKNLYSKLSNKSLKRSNEFTYKNVFNEYYNFLKVKEV